VETPTKEVSTIGAVKNLIVRVGMDASELSKSMALSNKQMKQMSKSWKSTCKSITVALGVATAAVGAFAISSVKDAMESENSIAQMNAVIKSTGGVAGMTTDELTKMSGALQKTTKYSDEQINAANSMLLTFTNIGEKTFPGATQAALDMAAALGGEPVDQSIRLGKALNNPIAGIGALTKVGVTFTEEQKNMIRAMQEGGDIAGAQAIILAELQKEFGGSAEAAGKTFAGQLAIASNALGEMKETIGKAVLPYLQQFLDWVNSHSTEISDGINGALKTIKEYVDTKLIPAIKDIMAWWQKNSDTVIPIVSNMAKVIIASYVATGVASVISTGIQTVQFAIQIGKWIALGAAAIYNGLLIAGAWLMALGPVGLVVGALIIAIAWLQATWDGWDKVTAAIKKAVNWLLEWLGIKTPAKNLVVNTTQNESKRRTQYANGTNFALGGLSLVGERGPELVDIPRGSKVYTNSETSRMLSGNNAGASMVNVAINLNNPVVREEKDIVKITEMLDKTLNDFWTKQLRGGVTA